MNRTSNKLYIWRPIGAVTPYQIMATERQNAILFTPKYLSKGFDFLSFITIIKNQHYTEYENFGWDLVKRKFVTLTEETVKSLVPLSNPSLFAFNDNKTKEYRKVQSGKDIEALVRKSRNRYLNEIFLNGLNYWTNLNWFHLAQDPITNKPVKCPCTFLNEKIELKFSVEHSEALGLDLIIYVQIKQDQYLVSDFKRILFLLEYKHQYVVLPVRDFQTLEWLEDLNFSNYAFNPKDFLHEIVMKLEAKGHLVDRNNCFKVQEIHSMPEPMVLVQEISDTFLQFTPCWNYEGIQVDGNYISRVELQRQDETYRVFRDKEAETNLIKSIQHKHHSFKQQFNGKFFIHFDEARKNNWFFSTYQQWLDQGVQLLGLDLLEHFKYSAHKINTSWTWVKSEDGISVVWFEVHFGEEKIQNKELQKVILAGQKSILLKDNTIGILPEDWRMEYALILKHAVIDGNQLTFSNWLLNQDALQSISDPKIKLDQVQFQEKWKTWQQSDSIIYNLPALIKAQLRPYQLKGFEWMALLSEMQSGACLADDMGLGKTLQTISYIAWLFHQHREYRFLIICPASLIYNWKSEFEKFAPDLSTRVFKGGIPDLKQFFESSDPVLIAGYGMVRSQIELLDGHYWGGVVVDESHNIKNPAAQITRAIHRLKAHHRVALSGTPVMNNTFDLYAQVEFIVPGLLGSAEFFTKEYANPIDKDGDKEKINTLAKLTAPFILRRTKKQVAPDLPEKTETILWCEMEDKQRAIYEEIKTSIRDNIFLNIRNEGLAKTKIGILAGIIKLRQVCCAPGLLQDFKGSEAPDSIKLSVLLDELQSIQNRSKALVFSQFKGMLHLIAGQLKQEGIAYYHFDGDTPIEERQSMVNSFQQENDPAKVFLISLKAGNTGLNLTAADYVFLVDPWWNTAIQQQAIDRTHRIGQNNHVFAYKMICKNTIEERIIQLQQKKQWISDELIHAEDGFVKNLSEEDVSFLFS